jgi:5-methylthioribose kinase
VTAPPEPMIAFAEAHGLSGSQARWEPLTGGVSSDIWHLSSEHGGYCIKRALPQLKVAATWEVPVDRNAYEWAYMRVADRIAPGAVPKPIAHDPEQGLFAMAWLSPDRHQLWKSELFNGRVDRAFAAALGGLVGKLHAATADQASIAARFATDKNFCALRLDPYLLEAARRHLDVAGSLQALAETTAGHRRVLVHGDVSPKNILIGPQGPVLLDAECAWFGDPAFDLAFCLNHLAIKARILTGAREALSDAFDGLTESYLQHVSWEPAQELERRAARLLPALALARVDGKSPVEYLDEAQRSALRAAARSAVHQAPGTLAEAKALLIS